MRFIAAIDTRFYGQAYAQGSEVPTATWSRKMLLQHLGNGLIQASQITAGAIQDAIVFDGADVTTSVDSQGRLVVTIETQPKAIDWLTDVDTTGAADGQTLVWHEGDQLWKPATIDFTGASITLTSLADVDTAGALNGSALVFDALSGTWVAGPPLALTFAELTDVDLTGLVDGQVPIWDDSVGKWVPGALTGLPGPGVPTGGLLGQMLVKLSTTAYDTGWATPLDVEAVRDTIGATLVAGANMSISVDDVGNTITLAAAGTDSEAVRDIIGATLVAGSNVTIAVDDPGNTVTIASTGGTSYTDENARDAIGTALVAGANVSITVDDPGDHITIAATNADSETYSYTGNLTPNVGAHRLYNDSGHTRTLTKGRASVGTAPTGASIVVDININGTTAFTSKPTITAGSNTGTATPSTTAWADGAYLTVDIDSVGSTLAGADLAVTVSWTE